MHILSSLLRATELDQTNCTMCAGKRCLLVSVYPYSYICRCHPKQDWLLRQRNSADTTGRLESCRIVIGHVKYLLDVLITYIQTKNSNAITCNSQIYHIFSLFSRVINLWEMYKLATVVRSAITFLMMYLNFVLRSNSCRQALFDFRCWTTLDYDSETLNANHIRFQLLSVKISSLPLM